MLKTIYSIIVAAVLVLGGTTGLLFFAHNNPSTDSLDSDLRQVHKQIADAETSSARFQGGVIKILIELRRQVLLTTEAMLQQKRDSLLRRIDLRYTIDGHTRKAPSERLRHIQNDIKTAKAKLEKDRLDATLRGGLIQAFAMMTVETDRLALAHLYVAYYDAKYEIRLPSITPTSPVEPKVPGQVVKDRNAL